MSSSLASMQTALAPNSVSSSSSARRVGRKAVVTRVTADADASSASSSSATPAKKVVVLGGSGFVGQRVVQRLAAAGAGSRASARTAKVTTISKSGTPVKGAKLEEKIDLSLTDDATFEALTDAMAGADAVVSCVGVIGGDDNRMLAGNGFNNVRGIKAAKAAGVERFVYVSVASIVPEVVGATPLMKGYFEGKVLAEEALAENYDAKDYCVVKPSFIYGGDEFSISPPRVTQTYGDILVKLLGSDFVKNIAEKTPGPIKLTLAEPVSVDDVAGACVAGAMGTNSASTCDGTDEIKAFAGSLV